MRRHEELNLLTHKFLKYIVANVYVEPRISCYINLCSLQKFVIEFKKLNPSILFDTIRFNSSVSKLLILMSVFSFLLNDLLSYIYKRIVIVTI